MADYVTTWTFDSDAEGWSLTDLQWTGSDGSDMSAASDPGCIETVTPGDEAGGSAKTRTMTLTGLTWEDLGVTPGDLVVQAVGAFRIKLVSVYGPFVEVAATLTVHLASDDSLVCTAYSDTTQRTGMLTGAWQTSSGSPGAVDATAEASDTPLTLKFTLSSASNAIDYGWEFRLDTLEFTTTGETETPPTVGDTIKIPLTERDFTMPVLSRTGVGLSNIAAYDYVCQIGGNTVTAATWKIRVASDVDPGVTANLNVYTGWYGEDGLATQSSSPGLSDATYTELSFAMDAGQLADWVFQNSRTVPFSIRLEITAGSGGASAYIVGVHLEIEADPGTLTFPDIPALGTLSPDDFLVQGEWLSDGPPMQNEPVTLLLGCYDRTYAPYDALIRTVHVLTDGSGAWSYAGREWCFAVTALAGWWYLDDTEPTASNRIKPAITGGFSPASLSGCATPAWMTPGSLTGRMARYSLTPILNNVALAWDHFTSGTVLSGTSDVGTEQSGYTPRVKFVGQCQNGGVFDMDGITLDVVGTYATESVTLDSAGETPLTTVDPQTIQSFANVVGLPACGSLRTLPVSVAPSGTNRGDLYPRYPATSVEAPFGLTHRAWFVPPACGIHTWVEPLLICTSCSGTVDSLRLNVDTHDPTGAIAVAWINDSGALKVAVNPEPSTCIAEADGSRGWSNIVTLEASNASDLGLVVLPNGRIYVCYDLSGAKKYRTTDKLGFGSAGDWSASATPSPAVSRHSDQSRGEGQANRFRGLGGTPNLWQGSGNIEFSQCRDNTGASWTNPTTVVSGARGLFCGGSWIGQGYGCLYTKESDGLVYWITSDRGDSWSGSGTLVSALTTIPVSLARHPSGALCAVCWDPTAKTTRSARSRDRGATWEFDSSDIDGIPPLTQPPMIVCLSSGTFFIVWVANDTPDAVYSVDGGVTWAG